MLETTDHLDAGSGLLGSQCCHSVPCSERGSYTCNVFLVRVVKHVNLLLEGVQDLSVSGHVCGQDQRDGSLRNRKNQ